MITPGLDADHVRCRTAVDLNIRVLRYFVALVDEGHLGRAASKLLISTTALSQQIRQLERQVGFVLVDPISLPVAPTPEGAAFLPAVRVLLAVAAHAAHAAAVAQTEARVVVNRFALGFVGTPLGRFTRTVLAAFNGLAGPGVLQMVELPLAEQTSAVTGGLVDASLAWGPVDAPDLMVESAVSSPDVDGLRRSPTQRSRICTTQ